MRPLKLFLIFIIFLPGELFAQNEKAIGDWGGHLKMPQNELRILFHIELDSNDQLTGTMDSPDQGVQGVPLGSVKTSTDSLWVEIPAITGTYNAAFVGTDSLQGKWLQAGMELELGLKKGSGEWEGPSRPQTPEAPYPYRVIDTSFQQQKEDFRLAGTLTMPEGEGPFPALALVSGSGPQDRNETVMGHKPFHVIADRLTREGFAVLRYDDRGVAESEGDFNEGTIDKFTEDANSAFEFLKNYEKVDPERVGMLGHSEGGVVISQLAAEKSEPAFLVLLASPALPGDSTLFMQNRAILEASGMTEDMVEDQVRLLDSIFTYMREGRDSSFIMERSNTMLEEVYGDLYSKETMDMILRRYESYIGSEWFRSFIDKDPRKDLRELDLPILALFGENDLQILYEENEKAMRRVLEGNENATIETFEGVNHLFQPDSTGLPQNYGKIETTIHPPVLDRIGEWTKEVTQP